MSDELAARALQIQRLLEQGALDQALALCRATTTQQPDFGKVYYNLGAMLAGAGRLAEATECLERAERLDATTALFPYWLGDAYFRQCRFGDAASCFERAVALAPLSADAICNLGAALIELNRLEEAVAWLRRAVALAPDFARAHYNLGLALLTLGRLSEGWQEYDWLWKLPANQGRAFPQPRWSGEPLVGKTILLTADQGHGDALQTIRYAELVKRRGARVVVECQPSLARLLGSCAGVDRVVTHGDALGEFDVHVPLLRLPGVFGTTLETIPATVPYLRPDAIAVERWRRELAGEKAFKVGIAWEGGADYWRNRVRSIPLARFAGLARIPGVQVYSLQVGAGREQLAALAGQTSIIDLGDRVGDFDNTAALMRNLDLVITCDSAPGHLAGALAVPVWVAVAFAPHWPWMLEREDTPWYPTMRLFRQSEPGDWNGVFERIERELTNRQSGQRR